MTSRPEKYLVLLVLLLVIAVGCEPVNNAAQPWTAKATEKSSARLSTRGRWIVDREGRTVILRGVNYNGIESMLFTDQPPLLSDFQQIRRWGFNVIRFPMSWDFIEPTRGVYDETYLTQWVEPVLDYADQTGLMVVFEIMHQWNWSACFNSDGRGNGAPKWALPPWARELCPGTYSYGDGGEPDAYTQMERGAADFWLDMEAREELIQVWEMMVRRYQDRPIIVAYDIFNEPNPGDIWTAHPAEFDQDILQPYHEEIIRRIRAIDPDRPIIYECSIMHDLYPNYFTPMPFPNLIYSTHHYTGGQGGGSIGGYNGDPGIFLADLGRGVLESKNQGVPLWIGEFGIGVRQTDYKPWIRDMMIFQDHFMIGSVWWSMRQHDNLGKGLTNFDTRTDKPELLDFLARPYPAATPGELLAFNYDVYTKIFAMTFANRKGVTGDTEIAIPEYQYPDGIQVECSDEDGQWSYNYDPADGFLHLRVDPHTSVHTIRVLPKY